VHFPGLCGPALFEWHALCSPPTRTAWCAWSKCAKPSLLPLLQGDASAPPPPAPRQGPRQLLSSLLGLADLCPDEWPARGASQAAARHRDAAAAEGLEILEGGMPYAYVIQPFAWCMQARTLHISSLSKGHSLWCFMRLRLSFRGTWQNYRHRTAHPHASLTCALGCFQALRESFGYGTSQASQTVLIAVLHHGLMGCGVLIVGCVMPSACHTGSPFERPSLISLRGQLALSLEVHWDRLQVN
jgi:hypothetical protein